MNKVEFLTKVIEKIDKLAASVDHTKIDDVSSDVLFKIHSLTFSTSRTLELFDELGVTQL